MKASVAFSAPTTPPETGASTLRWPAASASACASRASSTAIVEESMKSVPGAATASRPSAPSAPRYASITCAPLGNIVMTTASVLSLPADASCPDVATPSPAARAASIAAGNTSKPTTS